MNQCYLTYYKGIIFNELIDYYVHSTLCSFSGSIQIYGWTISHRNNSAMLLLFILENPDNIKSYILLLITL